MFSQFFSNYFLYLFFGAFFICGFFSITRGNIEILPDGTKKKQGKILKSWFLFWFQEKENPKLVHYTGSRLTFLLKQVNNVTGIKVMPTEYHAESIVIPGRINTSWQDDVERALDIKIIVTAGAENDILCFAKEYTEFVFPWYIRDMMAGCITCHSSWLGSICFWVPYFLCKKYFVTSLFNFTDNLLLSLILTWIAYCISLAFITTGIWKKYMA